MAEFARRAEPEKAAGPTSQAKPDMAHFTNLLRVGEEDDRKSQGVLTRRHILGICVMVASIPVEIVGAVASLTMEPAFPQGWNYLSDERLRPLRREESRATDVGILGFASGFCLAVAGLVVSVYRRREEPEAAKSDQAH